MQRLIGMEKKVVGNVMSSVFIFLLGCRKEIWLELI